MATIDWASAQSGTFSTAADWQGGITPGSGDTAVIQATGHSYTVTIVTAADVAALILASATATLAVDSGLDAQSASLQAGTLLLGNGASLAGTYTDGAASVVLAAKSSVTLNDVTWNGYFDPLYAANATPDTTTLTITNGLTLRGSNGTGPGSAHYTALVLNNVSSLTNAVMTMAAGGTGISVINTATLTLGNRLTLTGDLYGQSGATVINLGTLTADQAAAQGRFVNHGSLIVQDITSTDQSAYATINGFGGTSFTNDGAITVAAGAHLILDYAAIQAPGAGGSIALQGGVLELVGSLTTAQLLSLYGSQRISGAVTAGTDFGFGVLGKLTNTGATLNLGPDTALGLLDIAAGTGAHNGGSIFGGTIDVADGGGTLTGGQSSARNFTPTLLSHLTLNSADATLSLANIGMANDTISGAATIDVANGRRATTLTATHFSGASALAVTSGYLELDNVTFAGNSSGATITADAAGVALNGVSFTGLSGGPTINATGAGASISFSASQTINGWTINATGTGGYLYFSNGSYDGATIDCYDATLMCSDGTVFGAGTRIDGNASSIASDGRSLAGVTNQGLVKAAANGEISVYGVALSNSGTISGGALAIGAYGFTASLANAGLIKVDAVDFAPALTGTALNNTGIIDATTLDCVVPLINSGTITVQNANLMLGDVTNTGTIAVVNGALSLHGSTTLAGLDQFLSFITLSNSTVSLANGTLSLAGNTVNETALAGVFTYGDVITNGTLVIDAGATPSLATDLVQASVTNNGDIDAAFTQFGAVSGTGTIEAADTVFSGTVSTGQTIVVSPNDFAAVAFNDISSSGSVVTDAFAGTLSGFSSGTTLLFYGLAGLSGASFVGDSILATLSDGGSFSIATSTALSGDLTVGHDSLGHPTIEFASATAGAGGWAFITAPEALRGSAEYFGWARDGSFVHVLDIGGHAGSVLF